MSSKKLSRDHSIEDLEDFSDINLNQLHYNQLSKR
jgi:hypothetical protein